MTIFYRYRLAIFLVLAVVFAAGALTVADLALVVTSRFNGRRWNLPSRIYSDVETVSDGLNMPEDQFVRKLHRLLYASTTVAVSRPGEFRASQGRVEVWLRSFDELGRHFDGYPVTIRFSGGKVVSLETPQKDRLTSVVLEPELIGSIYDRKLEDRTLVLLSDVPRPLIDAILEREDRGFYHHGGISFRRTLGAFVADIRHHGAAQGGSTLTQQLVKNLYLSPQRTIKRKVIEAMMATVLDACYSKDDILQAYLNEIYLGQRGSISITGVGEASKFYFGKNVANLDVAECAMLAGMIASPGRFNPWRHPDRCRARRDGVLKMMLDDRKITPEQYPQALAEPLTPLAGPPQRVQAPHFVDFVEQQLSEKYGAKLRRDGLQIYTTLNVDLQQEAQAAISNGLDRLQRTYPRIARAAHQGDTLQGALIVLDPQTGAVKALVGGRDYALSQFNRVTQAHRQPGSLFKPFVYCAAFANRTLSPPITPATILIDSPITLVWGQGGPDQRWTPHNDDNQYRGPISVRRALELSVNIPAVRVAVRTGLDSVVSTARACGITSRLQGYPSLALGSFDVSPMEIAAAYSIFADGGVRVEPDAIVGIADASGKVLQRNETPLQRVLPPDAVFLTNSLMQGVVNRGTGGGIRARGIQGVLAGKTGTTNEERDAWFIGFSPRILAAVWVGFDDNRPVKLSGSQAAVPIFADFIKNVPSNLLSEKFPVPADIVTAQIDPETGMLVTPYCPETMTEAFIQGTAPTQYCTVHGIGGTSPGVPEQVPPPGVPAVPVAAAPGSSGPLP